MICIAHGVAFGLCPATVENLRQTDENPVPKDASGETACK